jgi:hypothetical protein
MSDAASSSQEKAVAWPASGPLAVEAPVTQASLANAAARAAASNSRRDLVAYLRLRRKPA